MTDKVNNKSLTNSPLNIIVGKIHQAYTVASDELFMRGYMTQDERMAIGGLIGDLLVSFRDGLMKDIPNLAKTEVDADDVNKIVELFTMKDKTELTEVEKKEIIDKLGITPEVTESKEANLLSQLLTKFDEFITSFKAGARHSGADQTKVQNIHDHSVDLGASCPMSVFKDANDKWRWVLFSSSAFKDKDGEIVSTKAQEDDIARMDASGDYGVLRWWHVGNPYTTKSADWKSYTAGPGINLGTCDYSAMQGRIRVESGTFDNDAVGEAFSKVANKQSVSIGFSHPDDEPVGGTFENIHTFERSLLPDGINSNYLADVLVITKENKEMDDKKVNALKELLGDELTTHVLAQAAKSDKEAEALGLKFKAKKVAEMDETELKDFIGSSVKAAMQAFGKPAKGETDGQPEPDADDKSKKEHEDATQVALKALEKQISDQADYLLKQDAKIKELLGEVPPVALAKLRRSNASDNIVTDKTKLQQQQPAQKSQDASDFLDFAVTGGTGKASVPNG